MKRYTKYSRVDPHPEIPFSNVEPDGLPTAKEAGFWFVAVFILTVIGCYLGCYPGCYPG